MNITIKTNIDQVAAKITKKALSAKSINNITRIIAWTMLDEIRFRIANKGQAVSGKIGSYSTSPIYVNPNRSPKKFATLGKTKKDVFASTGKKHSTGYFSGGYSQFKTAIGRNTAGTVNLYLTGQFLNNMTVLPTSRGWGIGWQQSAFLARAFHFEKKYGKTIFGLSARERKLMVRIINQEIKRALS